MALNKNQINIEGNNVVLGTDGAGNNIEIPISSIATGNSSITAVNTLTELNNTSVNDIVEIQSDIDLLGGTITLPIGTKLFEKGGLLTNGTILINEGIIDNSLLSADLNWDANSTGNLTNPTYIFDKNNYPINETIVNPLYSDLASRQIALDNKNIWNKMMSDISLFNASTLIVENLDAYFDVATQTDSEYDEKNTETIAPYSLQLLSNISVTLADNVYIREYPRETYASYVFSASKESNFSLKGGNIIGSRDTRSYVQYRPIPTPGTSTTAIVTIGENESLVDYTINITPNNAELQAQEIVDFINNSTQLSSLGYSASIGYSANVVQLTNSQVGLYFRFFTADLDTSGIDLDDDAFDVTFGHLVAIFGCKSVLIENVKISKAYGDGIVIGASGLLTNPGNVNSELVDIKNCTVTQCRRINISPLSVDGCIIENNIVKEGGIDLLFNKGASPRGNIWFEPFRARNNVTGVVIDYEKATNILVQNNYVVNGEHSNINAFNSRNVRIIGNVTNGTIQSRAAIDTYIVGNTIDLRLEYNGRDTLGNRSAINTTAFNYLGGTENNRELTKNVVIRDNFIYGNGDSSVSNELAANLEGWNIQFSNNQISYFKRGIKLISLRESLIDQNKIQVYETIDTTSQGFEILSGAFRNVTISNNYVKVHNKPFEFNGVNNTNGINATNLQGDPSIIIKGNTFSSWNNTSGRIRSVKNFNVINNEFNSKCTIENTVNGCDFIDNIFKDTCDFTADGLSLIDCTIRNNTFYSSTTAPGLEIESRSNSSNVLIANNIFNQPNGVKAIYIWENGGVNSNFNVFGNKLLGFPTNFIEFYGNNSNLLNNTDLQNNDNNLVIGANNFNEKYSLFTLIPIPFISNWDTTADNETVTLPLTNAGTHDILIDWGDGGVNEVFNAIGSDLTHTYATTGSYTISISGDFKGLNFNNSGDLTKIKDVSQWGNSKRLRINYYGCTAMSVSATDAPDISSMTTLSNSFRNCDSIITPNFNNWNVSNISNFQGTFRDMSSGCPIINNWNTVNATTMNTFLLSNDFFNQDISSWNIENLSNLGLFNRNGDGWSTANYDATLIGWANQNVQTGLIFDAGNVNYSAAATAARDILINTYGWTINDNGLV